MNCPTCKNPIQDNSYECEWCGNQINVNDIKNNLDNALVDIIKSENHLEAIVYYMDNYKVTLKEAKNKIDTLISELNQSGASIINDAQNLDKSNKNTVKSKNDIFVILGIAAILLFFWVLRKLV